MWTTIKQWLGAAADVVMPRVCPVCGQTLDGDETWLCRHCLAGLPRTRYEEVTFNTMEQHFAGKVPIERATAYFFYEKGSPYASILHDIKYHGTPTMGRWLTSRAVRDMEGSNFFDVMVGLRFHFVATKTSQVLQSPRSAQACLAFGSR